jgi:hypothetical protein
VPVNGLLTDQEITMEALMILKNSLRILPNITNAYEDRFGKAGHKIGDTLYVRKPQRYIGTDGPAYNPEGLSDTQTPLKIDQWSGVHMGFDSREKKLSLDDFSKRYIRPAAVALANKLDRAVALAMYQGIFNSVGTPGTIPNSVDTYISAKQKLEEMGAPEDGEFCAVITPAMKASIVSAVKGLFNPAASIGKTYRTGQITDEFYGFDGLYMDQNIVTHTVGTQGGTPLVDGANQTAEGGNNATMSLILKGWTHAAATRLNRGDIFTLDSVYAVNPQNRQSTGALQQFVVLDDAASDAGGGMTVNISPAITPFGQYQNVDAAAADSAAVTVLGASATKTPQALAFHKTAFGFVSVPLDVPEGVDMAYSEFDDDLGMHLRFVRQYQAVPTDLWASRLELIWGVSPLYREMGCRIAS